MTEPTQPPAPPEEPQDAPRERRLDAESADNTTDALLRQPQLRETSERQALDAALHQAKLVHEFADRPPQPVPFRRWEVRRRIGRGAMGAVYLARDPALGRDVALKLISSVDGAPLPLHATREARALAAIAHPNVVQIHSVDESSPRTLILEMEYVDGPHLGAWAATPGRPWRDLVTAIAGAGDGLAALHAKAILHRDIKPENIVIGRDGRPRLVDLGLAVARDRGSRRGEGPATPSASPLALHLSAAGALHGTLGYLAPEVLLSDQATPQSDLFSLASTLFTGLYGHLPYHGESPKDLAQALRAGRLAIPDDAPRYPAWLLRILRRALAFDPEERPQEVAEFVHELRRGLGRRRRLLGIMGLLGAVVTLPLVGWTLGPAPADPCAEAGAEFAVIAAADRIPSLRDRLGAAAIPPQTIASLEGLLHTRRQGWTAAARQSCLRGQQRPRWVGVSGVEDLRRERCLAATARRLDHLLGLPAAPATEHPATERHGLQQLTAIFAALEALPTCDGAELYHWTPSRDPAALDRLDHALGLALAGTYAAAATLAAELAASPELDPYHRAEAHYLVGYSHGQRRQLRTAALALTRARDLAFASGHDVLLCRITAYQAKLAAVALLDAGAAERLIADAAACAARLGPRAPLLGAELAEAHGLVAEVRGDPTTAAAHHRRALRLRSAILGEDHLDTTRSLHNLGNSLGERGSPGDRLAALGHLRQAVERRRRALGAEHPLVADLLLDLGSLHGEGAPSLAREAFLEAQRIYGARPEEHASSALKAATALAQLDLEEGALADAAAQVAAGRQHLAGALAQLPPGHPALADFRGIAGQVAARQDDFVTAEAELAAGLHSLPETARVRRAALLAEWIEAATATGRRGALIRALLGSLKIDPPGPPQLAPELLAHLENEAAARRGTLAWYAADALQGATLATEAVPFLRVAVAAYEELVASADEPPLRELSELRFALAQALAAHDLAEATALAEAAAAGYRALGDHREAAAIDVWRRASRAR